VQNPRWRKPSGKQMHGKVGIAGSDCIVGHYSRENQAQLMYVAAAAILHYV